MAVNQAKIFQQLEQLTGEIDRDEFIYCNDPAVPAQLSGFGIGLRRCFHL